MYEFRIGEMNDYLVVVVAAAQFVNVDPFTVEVDRHGPFNRNVRVGFLGELVEYVTTCF